METPGFSIFLSHSVSEADTPLLAKIDSECQSLQIGVYIAEREFSPNTVTDKLRNAIASADAFVVLLTTSGASSAWVNTEVGIALEQGKPIIPLIEEGVAAPGPVRDRDRIRFSRGQIDKAIERATRFLQTLRRSVPESAQAAGDSGSEFAAGFIAGAALAVLVLLILVALASKE